MVQVSALFAAFPTLPHAQLLGSNKVAACPGMALALRRYLRSETLHWRVALPTAVPYAIATVAGVEASRAASSETFRLLVPVMLIAVLAYVLTRRDFGLAHAQIGRAHV